MDGPAVAIHMNLARRAGPQLLSYLDELEAEGYLV
jgi:hypothetical protein